MFYHDRPTEGFATQYFLQVQTNKRKISIIVPFFNEEWAALRETLKSLHKCQQTLDISATANGQPGWTFTYMLIQDGWKFASESMKAGLQGMFPGSSYWKDLDDETKDKDKKLTYIFQSELDGKWCPTLVSDDSFVTVPQPPGVAVVLAPAGDDFASSAKRVEGEGELPLDLVLVIKKDNRKKHNSHEWFFSENGYCGAMNPEFCLATDCSTLFDPDCILHLVKVMDRETACSVCTGRQVVMSEEQQMHQSNEKDGIMERLYRLAQCYDFESSFSAFMGAFAIFGFLPVVPGPCGLYRWNMMKGDPLDWYFEIVNKKAEDCGVVLSNLKIAEDRILSYSAVLKTGKETKMCISPDAEFYFEAETELEGLTKQRRRWINGTLAGYVYMAQHPSLIWNSQMFFGRKLAVFFLIFCQLGIYAIVNITPAIFLSALYSILMLSFGTTNSSMALVLWLAYIIFFAVFMVAHSRAGPDNAFIGWMFYVNMFLSMFTVIVSFAASIRYLVVYRWHDPWMDGIIFLTYGVMATPIVIAVHRPKSLWRALKSFIPYYLFLPTLVAWFGAYSVARFWDVSWGNRPSGDHAVPAQQKLALKAEQARKKMMTQARTYAAFVLMANLIFILLYVQKGYSLYFLVPVAVLVCICSVVQMFISLIYFFLNFLLEKILFTAAAYIVGFLYRLFYGGRAKYWGLFVYEEIMESDPMSTRTAAALGIPNVSMVMLCAYQLATNFGYQAIFQMAPITLNHYDNGSAQRFAIESIGYPAFGFVSLLFGALGDKLDKGEFISRRPFKFMAAFGAICFCVVTLIFELVLSNRDIPDSTKYKVLLTGTYLQVLFLNIFSSPCFVVFLRYASTKKLLQFVAFKAIIGAVGDLIPPIINLSSYWLHPQRVSSILNGVTGLLLLISLAALLKTTNQNPPHQKEPAKWEYDNTRRVAIVLVSFFFLLVPISPIQFGLSAYFAEVGSILEAPETRGSFLSSSVVFLIQTGLMILIGSLTLFTPIKKHAKGMCIFLAITSLAQLLFLVPYCGNNKWWGFFIASFCGLYRTFPEIFAYFFFAREVETDQSHTGFWVASMNVTLVLAQLFGYNLLGSLLLRVVSMRLLFGIVALFGVMGIASVWRLRRIKEEETK